METMSVWGFLAGLILGFFPLLAFMRVFKGRLFFIENRYLKGALLGFFLWVLINIAMYVEMKYTLTGLLMEEGGFGTIVVITSSLQGFISAGLAAAFVSNYFGRKKKSEKG